MCWSRQDPVPARGVCQSVAYDLADFDAASLVDEEHLSSLRYSCSMYVLSISLPSKVGVCGAVRCPFS